MKRIFGVTIITLIGIYFLEVFCIAYQIPNKPSDYIRTVAKWIQDYCYMLGEFIVYWCYWIVSYSYENLKRIFTHFFTAAFNLGGSYLEFSTSWFYLFKGYLETFCYFTLNYQFAFALLTIIGVLTIVLSLEYLYFWKKRENMTDRFFAFWVQRGLIVTFLHLICANGIY